mgnify:CR=1 FL=1
MQEIRMWANGLEVEADAMAQLRNIASLPIVAGHIAVMPDVHLGKGATVGSVIPTKGAIIPAAVGVDIGCGMCAVRTTLTAAELPDSLAGLRSDIEAAIPVGFNAHKAPLRTFSEGHAGLRIHQQSKTLSERFGFLRIHERTGKTYKGQPWNQLGTLGGGNHFIEVCLSEKDEVWLMLHSGSRNIGKTIADVAINWAKEIAFERDIHLPDRDLAWLSEGSREFDAYVEALLWAQDYAALNRELMLHLLLKVMRKHFGKTFELTDSAINCHHNYAQREQHFGESVWLTRKGAVSARKGEMGIIPGSMGARSFIVRGLGHAESYCSCSHGAGRRMSRSEAKRRFTQADLRSQTAGVECRKDAGVIDEIPSAYKDIDTVMAAQAELVEIVATLKQVLCVKG